jgi:uncharacterized protein (TIGR03085 family)
VSSPASTPSALERARLAGALAAAGPGAPTLCTGWTTHDLAAHLVARERRPDSTPGLVVAGLSGWTERVRRRYAQRPYAELVELVRSGPPRSSPFALPGVDRVVNLTEHFVHCEDVLRGSRTGDDAVTPASPAVVDRTVGDALWGVLRVRGRSLVGRAGVAVVLATPDGREHRVGSRQVGQPVLRLTGEPGELVLLAFGRGRRAAVRREGDDEALAALAAADLRV